MSQEAVRQKKKELMLLSLSNYFYKEGAESFFKRHIGNEIAFSSHLEDPKEALTFNHKFIDRIHYSWVAELLPKFPKLVQDSILLSLPKESAEKIKKLTSLEWPDKPVNALVKNFGTCQLIEAFSLKDRIPIPFLPESLLNSLLSFQKEDLVLLADLMPMHQLSAQIKKIVDRNKLLALYSALTTIQQHYLKLCMQQRRQEVEVDIDLRSWSGDKVELTKKLQKMGLKQFSKALNGQDEDFVWYLSHILDRGRGNYLLEHVDSKQRDHENGFNHLCHAIKFITSKQK